jgi:hypothetical protein
MVTKKERETVTGRKQGKITAPKDIPPVTCRLQQAPPSTVPHFPIVSLKFESTNGLNYSVSQSPCDLIVPGNTDTDTPGGVLY